MAGPIRNLLQRRPLRNAVRNLLGLQPRYGSSRMDSASYSDEAQGADLDARPTRLPARRDLTNVAYQTGTTAQPVAPSPEARAVSMARTADAGRRQAAKRQEEGITAQPQAQPRPPETGGFSMQLDIGDTDAPPPNPLLVQADSYRKAAERERAAAAQMAQDPRFSNPSNPNYAVFQAQIANKESRAMVLDQQADQMIGRVQALDFTSQASRERNEHELALARINKPPDGMAENAQAFRSTILQNGMTSGAQLATDMYFAGLNANIPPNDAQYVMRLKQNQLHAAGVVVADRIAKRQPFGQGDPAIAEMAAILFDYAPRDPAMRARAVNAIVASAQRQTGFDSEWGRRFNSSLTYQIEQEIAARKK